MGREEHEGERHAGRDSGIEVLWLSLCEKEHLGRKAMEPTERLYGAPLQQAHRCSPVPGPDPGGLFAEAAFRPCLCPSLQALCLLCVSRDS